MPGRHASSADYRYGFNGMEKDDEVKGEGSSYSANYRFYDPRIGRWKSLDPVVHAKFSPYSAFDNNPILYKDPSGADSEGGEGDPPPENIGKYKLVDRGSLIYAKLIKASSNPTTRRYPSEMPVTTTVSTYTYQLASYIGGELIDGPTAMVTERVRTTLTNFGWKVENKILSEFRTSKLIDPSHRYTRGFCNTCGDDGTFGFGFSKPVLFGNLAASIGAGIQASRLNKIPGNFYSPVEKRNFQIQGKRNLGIYHPKSGYGTPAYYRATRFGKLGTNIGYLGIGLSVYGNYQDFKSWQGGLITTGQFTFRTIGYGASYGASVLTASRIGGQYAGAWGVAAGALVGLVWAGTEEAYTNGYYSKVKSEIQNGTVNWMSNPYLWGKW